MITENGCAEYSQSIDLYFTIGVADNTNNAIKLFPNPTTGVITITGPKGTTTVYDILGQVVLTTNTNSLDISQATNGIYFLRVQDDKGRVFVGKIVKD
jgi:hypothetical protein